MITLRDFSFVVIVFLTFSVYWILMEVRVRDFVYERGVNKTTVYRFLSFTVLLPMFFASPVFFFEDAGRLQMYKILIYCLFYLTFAASLGLMEFQGIFKRWEAILYVGCHFLGIVWMFQWKPSPYSIPDEAIIVAGFVVITLTATRFFRKEAREWLWG